MSNVIVFPRGQLSELDKARLDAAGIVAVEADDPSKVVQIIPCASIVTPDDMIMSLLEGVKIFDTSSHTALKNLHARLKKREDATSLSNPEGVKP